MVRNGSKLNTGYDECSFIEDYCKETATDLQPMNESPTSTNKETGNKHKLKNTRTDQTINISQISKSKKKQIMGVKKNFFSISPIPAEYRTISDTADVSTDDEFIANIQKKEPNISKANNATFRRGTRSKMRINHYFVGTKDDPREIKALNLDPSQVVNESALDNERTKFTMADASEVLEKMKKTQEVTENKPQNRFILGEDKPPASIKDVIALDDLRNRTIYDKVLKRETNGGFEVCWVQIMHGGVTCYRNSALSCPTETKGPETFKDPNTDKIYASKSTFDLVMSHLMILPSKPSKLSDWFCWSSPLLDVTSLVDISNAQIQHIRQDSGRYLVELTFDDKAHSYHITYLDLIFECNGHYFYFRVGSIDKFLKWILAYRMRKQLGIRRL